MLISLGTKKIPVSIKACVFHAPIVVFYVELFERFKPVTEHYLEGGSYCWVL